MQVSGILVMTAFNVLVAAVSDTVRVPYSYCHYRHYIIRYVMLGRLCSMHEKCMDLAYSRDGNGPVRNRDSALSLK